MSSRTPNAFKIIVATGNPHKLREFQHLLGESAVVLGLDSVPGAPETVENGPDFAGNAIKKSIDLASYLRTLPSGLGFRTSSRRAVAPSQRPSEFGLDTSRLWVLADDSGLEVDALDGAPGVHSARFAAEDKSRVGNASDCANRVKLLRVMQQIPVGRRQARFRCVLALIQTESSNNQPHLFEGVCEGSIGFVERGTNGFGYDPLFIPEGFEKTFAELGDEVKNKMSHRARAIEKLKRYLQGL